MLPPLGGVFPARESYALSSFKSLDPKKPLHLTKLLTAQELLTQEYASDAHFCAYFPSTALDQSDESFPRLAKAALSEIRERGADVLQQWWVAEIDCPGHLPHTSPQAALTRLHELLTLSPAPHVAYSTRSGWRLAWALSRPLPVDESEQRRRTFLQRHLPQADSSTNDWSRLWRVPKALRDQTPQWIQPWFELHVRDSKTTPLIDPDEYPLAGPVFQKKSNSNTNSNFSTPRPTNEEAEDILHTLYNQEDRRLESELRRRASGRTPLEETVFKFQPIAPPQGPGRTNAIQKIAGQAAAFWTPLAPQATPQLAYALLWPALMQLEPDAQTPCWLDEGWRAVTKYWAIELENTPPAPQHPIASIIDQQTTMLGSMIEGVRRWAPPDFPTDYDDQCLYVQKRMILVVRGKVGEWHVMRPDGYYDPRPVNRDSLIPLIRQLGLDAILPLQTIDGKQRTQDSLVREYGVPIKAKHLRVGILSPTQRPGGILHMPPGEQEGTLHVSLFSRRTDIEPAFNPQVDEWLRLLAGPENYPDLIRWLSYALDFEGGPICALACHGASGVGKTMLTQGLAESISPQGYATGADFGQYGDALINSPFLFVDEGFLSKVPVVDRANRFRTLVDGSPQTIEAKYQSKIQIRNPVRAVFMSNNADFVDDLTGGRELTAFDRHAIAIRVLSLPARQEAAEYLKSKGGLEYTRGWVDSSSGEPGKAILARHILYLYSQRHLYQKDRRFLVEGRTDELGILRQLETRSEAAEVVAETLFEMIEALGTSRPPKGMIYRAPVEGEKEEPGLFVTSSAVVEWLRMALSKRRIQKLPSRKAVTKILARFSHAVGKRIKYRDDARYAHLNAEELLRVAQENGHEPTTVLETIVSKLPVASAREARQSPGRLAALLQPNIN